MTDTTGIYNLCPWCGVGGYIVDVTEIGYLYCSSCDTFMLPITHPTQKNYLVRSHSPSEKSLETLAVMKTIRDFYQEKKALKSALKGEG
jgi:hypothetical protein